jgi:cold shock CspA family protein
MDSPILGRIIRIGPDRHYAFVRPNDNTANAFIPCGLVGNLEAGDCIRYAATEGPKGPRVTWLEVVA